MKPYYEHGGITIYHGDCQEVLTSLAPVSLVLTSPPYNLGKEYEHPQTWESYLEEQDQIVRNCVAQSPGAQFVWQVGTHVFKREVVPLDIIFAQLFWAYGLKLRNRVVWTIDHGLHCKKRFSGRHESALWFNHSEPYYFNLDAVRVPQKYPNKKYFKGPRRGEVSSNPLGANPGDVWSIPQLRHNSPEKTAHPCQFPELLVERFVRALCPTGGVVMDPFAGSGTTLAVAKRLGLHAIGIERSEPYCEIAARRLDNVVRQEYGPTVSATASNQPEKDGLTKDSQQPQEQD